MPYLIDKATGERVWVDNEAIAAKGVNAKLFDVPDGERLVVTNPHLGSREMDLREYLAGNALGNVETSQEQAARHRGALTQERYGGAGSAARAAVEGGLRGVSLGGSDVLLRGLGVSADDLRGRQEANPGLAIGSEIIGAAAPALFSGGATAEASAARVGAGLAERALVRSPAGIVSRVSGAIAGEGAGLARTAVAHGVEGAAFGVGSGISELAMSNEPLSAERVVSTLSSHALFGGGVSAGAGLFGRALELGVGKTRKLVEESAERFRAGQFADDVAPDLFGKSGAELDDLAKAEEVAVKARYGTEQQEAGVRFVDDARNAQEAFNTKHPWIVADDQARAAWGKSENVMRKALETPEHLAANPGQLGRVLEARATHLQRSIDNGQELAAKLATEDVELATKLGKQIDEAAEGSLELQGKLARRYADFADVKLKRGKPLTVSVEDAQRFRAAVDAGEVQGARAAALSELKGLHEQTQALRGAINDFTALGKRAPESERLVAIKAAKAQLAEGGGKGRVQRAGEGMLQTAITGLGTAGLASVGVPIFAAAPAAAALGAGVTERISSLLFKRAAKAGEKAVQRRSLALDAVFEAAKVAKRVAPVAATKVLTRVAFGDAPAEQGPPSKNQLVKAFRARESEIRAQVAPGPDGRLRMTMAARQGVADRFAGLRVTDPLAADQVETAAARRMEFLANKLPRRPGNPMLPLGPDRWRPSDFQIAKFARYVAAVEDPDAVVERIADASISPEDAEAMREVYPDTYAEIQQEIVMRAPELRQKLPYQREVALSIFFGVPVSGLMRPEMVAALQRSYTEDPGSEQGTVAPKASPQFGSLSKPEYTGAQRRQQS